MNKKITIASSLKNIKVAMEEILGLLKNIRAEESDIFDIRLSLEEAMINAIQYGNRLNKELTVCIDLTHSHNKITIAVEDQGRGFDYRSISDPTKEENLLKAKGRGIFLIRHLMDNVEFNKKGNRITMTKHLRRKSL